MIEIELANLHPTFPVDAHRITRLARTILRQCGPAAAEVSIAIVDDATIHALNRTYLGHDYPTDVLSFVLDTQPGRLEGEVIVSADTAQSRAAEFGWTPHDELLLYVAHGTLHLVGFDDQSEEAATEMRRQEHRFLAACGVEPGGTTAPEGPTDNRRQTGNHDV